MLHIVYIACYIECYILCCIAYMIYSMLYSMLCSTFSNFYSIAMLHSMLHSMLYTMLYSMLYSIYDSMLYSMLNSTFSKLRWATVEVGSRRDIACFCFVLIAICCRHAASTCSLGWLLSGYWWWHWCKTRSRWLISSIKKNADSRRIRLINEFQQHLKPEQHMVKYNGTSSG